MVADTVDPDIHTWDRSHSDISSDMLTWLPGRWVSEQLFWVMVLDSRRTSWALSDPVTSIDDIGRKFGLISYYKGGAVIRMMESFLGLPTLNKGLTSYLRDLAFSAAKEEDLFLHLEAAGLEDGSWPQGEAVDLTEVMQSWTQQAGLPLVTVKRAGAGLEVSQAWYQNTGISVGEQLWSIPLTIADLAAEDTDWEDTRPAAWLLQERLTIAAAPQVPLLNKKAMGYYRVTYEDSIWRDIAAVLAADHTRVHPHNRAQVGHSGR